ncbi:MAG: LysM peptidoglycan-binding domain-containing protein [Gammaproteobacteria bacterium]|nr:LysM peptidoglycan-binding domain-containing protein [Gammaproteobacteria bacterium]
MRITYPLPEQLAAYCLSLLLSSACLAQELFPRPAELQPDIDFWVRVYTEIDTNSGFIHDSRDVTVVYETLQLRGDWHADRKKIRAAVARYGKTLKHLSSDPSGELTAEERRVRDLWGEHTDSARLRLAAGNVRFQRGQSDRFQEGLARSGEWNAYIDAVLAERGLPRELGVLPHVESSFNADAYSSAGAAGIWQFTRATGRRYLQVDYVVDQRMDPFAATVAAAQLLEHNYQLTGTWPLALTAYNHGASSMRRASKQLGTTDIEKIVREYKGRSFGFASRNFYLSFLAALEVSSNPDRYFAPFNRARPVQYAEIDLPDYILVDSFSRAFNADFDLLRQHNRALLDPIWRGKKRIPQGFTVRVPRDSFSGEPQELLASIPDTAWFSEQTPDISHTVVRGDTASEIAARYGHSIRDIAAMNGLNRRYQIRVGQVLKLPLEGSIILASASGVTPATTTEDTAATEVQASAPATPTYAAMAAALDSSSPEPLDTVADSMGGTGVALLADPSDYTVADDQSIEVQASETLGHYAEWLDIRASQLRRLNGRRYGRPVVIGQRVKLDFSKIKPEEFERRRIAYQKQIQQAFFMGWHIRTTHKHVIAPGESLWELTRQQYKVPLWLLRQYNPDLDPDRLHPGMVIVIPELATT